MADLAGNLIFVTVVGFVLFRVLPGDPVQGLTRGRATSPEQLAALRRELGLDRPLAAQFAGYVSDVLHGDLGVSYAYHRPVADLILDRLGPTLLLVGTATVLSVVLGAYGGVLAGWRPGSPLDRSSTATALLLWAMPSFWVGLVLLVALGAGTGWFPVGGLRSTDTPDGMLAAALDAGRHLVLPCLSLVVIQYGQYHLLMRSSVSAERDSPYLRLARAKGLREAVVRRRHAVPNALLPTAVLALVNAGYVVSGAVAVEAVFSWPGLGYLAYEALQTPDLPVLHGTFLVFSVPVVVATMGADLLRGHIDPRLTG
ncbi:ABC transporter permease [Actinoplanes sp. NPDC051861]|uniref:ABC transporter permease n=1 Tax=Actinoplanes sp. NPDC051861 TaxID=3155170 RepID=UPI0034393648